MKKKGLHSVLFITLIAALVLVLTTGASLATEKTVRWKGQTCFGVASPLGQHTIVLWKKFVEQMSGGRMQLTLHDAGEIVPPTKIYDAVKDGLLDFGLNTPAWQKGKYPAGDLFYTLPAGILEFNDLILWLYGGGGKELEQEMYGDELIVFPLGLTPPEEIWSKKPIKTLADIKGIKIRAYGVSMASSEPPHLFGGYSEFVYLSAGSLLHNVAPEASDVSACLSSVAGNGVRWVKTLGFTTPYPEK